MPLPLYQVDAFTTKPYTGNPAGIVLLDGPRPEEWLKNVASEMNLSETAFVLRTGDTFSLRWFTPAVEVALCGHATLASAHILWETGLLGLNDPACFDTLSGRLTCRLETGWIVMDFPAKPVTPVAELPGLVDALGAQPVFMGKSHFDYLVEFDTEDQIRSLQPNFSALKTLDARGVIVTSRAAKPELDFVSRFFAPAVGVDEDPVTGSAHCCLAPYWSDRLGKSEFTAYQVSQRGGLVRVSICGDRVLLSGKAVTIFKGELLN